MKEHPLIFSGPMVRSLLAGSKTQTRRKVARQPPEGIGSILCDGHYAPTVVVRKGEEGPGRQAWGAYDLDGEWGCYAPVAPGDLLWVKETWRSSAKDVVAYRANGECGAWLGDGGGGRIWMHHGWMHVGLPGWMQVGAVGDPPGRYFGRDAYGGKWRSSMFMPRWASRISLRVENVRCERLHDISDADIAAEDMDTAAVAALWEKAPRKALRELAADGALPREPRDLWRIGWTLLYGAESWDQNPLVWAYTFRREAP